MLRTDSTCSALRHHVIVALTRRAARRERSFLSRHQQRAAQDTEAAEGTGLHSCENDYSPFISRRDRDLGRSRTISSELMDMDSTWSA